MGSQRIYAAGDGALHIAPADAGVCFCVGFGWL
jgi:hypothetical protein